jgi:hypothetical protein
MTKERSYPLPNIRQEALDMLSAADDNLPAGQSYTVAAVVSALIYIGDSIASLAKTPE